MDNIKSIVWLLPIIFMLHDFEEIILVGSWKKKYSKELEESTMGKRPYTHFHDTASFSTTIGIIFLIYTIGTLVCVVIDNYYFWFGMMAGFILHFSIHYKDTFKFKHFVPGVVTSIVFLPICFWAFWRAIVLTGYSNTSIILASIICSIITIIVFRPIKKTIKPFYELLQRYSNS